MSIKKNIMQRIHESEDCPICMKTIEIEEKVYTEQCNHVYCIWCMRDWCTDNITCPMDRLNLVNLYVYNPIENDIKVIQITNFSCENICRERHNVFKMFVEEIIKKSLICIANYNHVILLSNAFEDIYEIFTEESFQILLDMDPNDSVEEFGVFLQSINSMKSEFFSKFEYSEDTFAEIDKIIKKKLIILKVIGGNFITISKLLRISGI